MRRSSVFVRHDGRFYRVEKPSVRLAKFARKHWSIGVLLLVLGGIVQIGSCIFSGIMGVAP